MTKSYFTTSDVLHHLHMTEKTAHSLFYPKSVEEDTKIKRFLLHPIQNRCRALVLFLFSTSLNEVVKVVKRPIKVILFSVKNSNSISECLIRISLGLSSIILLTLLKAALIAIQIIAPELHAFIPFRKAFLYLHATYKIMLLPSYPSIDKDPSWRKKCIAQSVKASLTSSDPHFEKHYIKSRLLNFISPTISLEDMQDEELNKILKLYTYKKKKAHIRKINNLKVLSQLLQKREFERVVNKIDVIGNKLTKIFSDFTAQQKLLQSFNIEALNKMMEEWKQLYTSAKKRVDLLRTELAPFKEREKNLLESVLKIQNELMSAQTLSGSCLYKEINENYEFLNRISVKIISEFKVDICAKSTILQELEKDLKALKKLYKETNRLAVALKLIEDDENKFSKEIFQSKLIGGFLDEVKKVNTFYIEKEIFTKEDIAALYEAYTPSMEIGVLSILLRLSVTLEKQNSSESYSLSFKTLEENHCYNIIITRWYEQHRFSSVKFCTDLLPLCEKIEKVKNFDWTAYDTSVTPQDHLDYLALFFLPEDNEIDKKMKGTKIGKIIELHSSTSSDAQSPIQNLIADQKALQSSLYTFCDRHMRPITLLQLTQEENETYKKARDEAFFFEEE